MSEVALECVSSSLVKPFIESTKFVFSTMLGADVEVECESADLNTSFELSGIIGFSGAIRGTAVISVNTDVAFEITELLLGNRPTTIDDEVRDMVGELANMIGGGAKERLANSKVSLGLPTVVSGKGHEVRFEPSAFTQRILFTTPWGPIAIGISMRANKE